ncbi:hypothetical protein JCM10213_000810 [Rhodosporidiobolus nylandii]
MQRLQPLITVSYRHGAARAFSTTPLALSKASKTRAGKKFKFGAPAAGAFTPPAPEQAEAAATGPGQAGTDAGQANPLRAAGGAGRGGLFEADEVTPEQIEKEMLAAQGGLRQEVDGHGERENLAGTDVAQGGEAVARTTGQAEQGEYGPEEVIYTTSTPYNVALMLTVAYVMGVFSFAAADFARAGVEYYDEETGEYRVAPAWKRYTFAAGAAGVGTAIVWWGSKAPSRIITKMTLRRSPASLSSPYPFPRDSLVTLHHPLSHVLQKVGVKPTSTTLSKIHLLGALTDNKPYHPLIKPEKPGRFATLLRRTLPILFDSTSPSRQVLKKGTHAPFVVEGERFTRSLALKRASPHEPNSSKGAWCKDWNALERALLGVDEAQWAKRL